MRKKGFRLVQVWVPDVRAPAFATEARRQSAAVGSADRDTDDQTFVDEVSIEWDE
jgi:Protein  of unknown function (DUF3018)